METKIQLIHPSGKKAIRMDTSKYTLLKEVLLNSLKTKGESTHAELLLDIIENLKNENTKFEGSIEWHLEWVKLDLEAKKVIKRLGNSSPVKFAFNNESQDRNSRSSSGIH